MSSTKKTQPTIRGNEFIMPRTNKPTLVARPKPAPAPKPKTADR